MCGFELVFTILDIPIDIIIPMLSFENIKYLKKTYAFPSDFFLYIQAFLEAEAIGCRVLALYSQ